MITLVEDTILKNYLGLGVQPKIYYPIKISIGEKTGTTAEIYAVPPAILNSDVPYIITQFTPIPIDLNPVNNFIAMEWADFFQQDWKYTLPLVTKYGFSSSFMKQLSPLSDDFRNEVLRYDKNEVKKIERSGSWLADHSFQHNAYIAAAPTYDGRSTPSDNDLRVNRGDGNNEFGHDINATVDTSISQGLRKSFLGLSDTIGSTAWKDLTDANCVLFRKSMSIFGVSIATIEGNYTLQALDYLSNRYCGTTGRSVFDDYTTRNPNTVDGAEPSMINPIIGGIFKGASTTQNHEIWERIFVIINAYDIEFYNKAKPLYLWGWPGGMYGSLSYNIGAYPNGDVRYMDKAHTKVFCGASKYISSIFGTSRSWNDALQNAGYLVTIEGQGEGYGGSDGITRLEVQRMFKKNGIKKPDNVGDGSSGGLRVIGVNLSTAEINTLLTANDLVKELYDFDKDTTSVGSFFVNLNQISRDNAWGLIPDLFDDSGYDPVGASYTLKLEALFQYCVRAGISVISYEEAMVMGITKSLPLGYNYFPNSVFATIVKTITNSANAPIYPDGWNGGVVLSEDTGGGAVNVIHKNTDGAISTRQYAIKPGTFNLSFKAKGIGILKISKIINKDPFNTIEMVDSFDEINSIAINSPDNYTEYTATISIPDAAMEVYSTPETLLEEVYQNYMKGYGDKICGIQIKLIVTGGNYVKLGNPSLI